jgi:hypothetical protein
VAGVGGPVSRSNQWEDYSALNLITGAFILPAVASTKTTVLYIVFTAGTEADIGNIVLYTTKRGSYKITAVRPVKLKGGSNPIISLTDTKVCPTQPTSVTNPCLMRLDPITRTLSTLSDYYFVMYLGHNTNNHTVGDADAQYPITCLTGWFLGATKPNSRLVTQFRPATTGVIRTFFCTSCATRERKGADLGRDAISIQVRFRFSPPDSNSCRTPIPRGA